MPERRSARRLPPGTGFTPEGAPVVRSPKDEWHEIRTVDGWLEWAGPLRGRAQWKRGRSAMEVARAWCGAGPARVPAELEALLASNPAVGQIEVATVIPELPTPLGDVSRGARRHDLILLGVDRHRTRTVIGFSGA